VTVAIDAIQKAMENEILKLGRNLRKGGVGLFYLPVAASKCPAGIT
jgi:hypothetical protein